MSRGVDWHELAQEDLLRMPWRAAALVDEAIQRFAERGEGSLRSVTVDGRKEHRLYVPPYFAWLSVTHERVLVWRVLRYA